MAGSGTPSGGKLPPETVAALKRFVAAGWDAKTVGAGLRLPAAELEAALRRLNAEASLRARAAAIASRALRVERHVIEMIDAARREDEALIDAHRRLVIAGVKAEAAGVTRNV